jgi:DNA-directed RNA polymerase specialized sigma subunit
MITNIKELIDEYKPDHSIFTDDDDMMINIKEAVQRLSDADRIIFILYCETGSLREVGKVLGVSHTTVFKAIKDIKQRILDDIGFTND